MTPETHQQVDYVARCLDNAVYIGLGLAAFFIMPRQARQKRDAGKITANKADQITKLSIPLGSLCIGIGILRIAGVFP